MNQYFNEAFQQMLLDRALREGARGGGRLLPRDWRYGVSLGADSPDPRNFDPTYRERVPGPQSMLMEQEAPPRQGRVLRMRPPVDPWQQYQYPYPNTPRDQIPPNMRPPLDAPDVEPTVPEERWRRRIT
jgi:hypothetical protein